MEKRKSEAEQDRQRSELLQSLTPEDYDARFKLAKAKLLNKSPWFVSREGSALTEIMIKSLMIERLETERKMIPETLTSTTEPPVISPQLLLPPPSGLDLTS
jgi:hypothetical protein